MIHLDKTRIYLILLDKININIVSILLVFVFFNCFQNSYLILARENPGGFLEKKDSLIAILDLNKNLVEAIIFSHTQLGLKAVQIDDHENAIFHFEEILSYDNKDSVSLYNLNLAKGHKMYLTGNTHKLWDAIQFYSKAAQANDKKGEPHYYIGLSYYKLSDVDFDLIIESYDNALARFLTDQLREEILSKRKKIQARKIKLEAFWN